MKDGTPHENPGSDVTPAVGGVETDVLAPSGRPSAKAAPAKLAVAAAAILGLFVAPAVLAGTSGYLVFLASLTLVYVLGAAGLNLILGYAGQISLAQGAFMGLGGYVVAILGVKGGMPLWITLPAGVVLGFALGIVIGIPALRVTLHYLAMITLGVHVVFLLLAQNEDQLTGGAFGIDDIARPSVGSVTLASDRAYHVFIAVIVVLGLAVLYWILNSSWGRAFKGLRENEVRAAMLGVNIRRYKLYAFAIGSAIAALAGGLLAPLLGFIDPTSFGLTLSFQLLLMVVVGGIGRFEGPILGAMIVTLVPELLRATEGLYLIIFALLTILLLIYMPKGMITLWDVAYRAVTGRPAPSLTK